MKLKNYRPLISRNFFEMRDLAEAEAKTRTAVDLRISKNFREITAGLTLNECIKRKFDVLFHATSTKQEKVILIILMH